MKKDVNGNDLHPDDVGSIVRSNMMNDVAYRPYGPCISTDHPNYDHCKTPRAIWDFTDSVMICPSCKAVISFPADFIVRYKDAHNLA